MLTRVYIDNFRCFVNFEYRPGPRQLLLGANGSGKSSLLSAIRGIKGFIKGDESPFFQSSRTRWQDKPLQVFEIDALLQGKNYRYRLEIQYTPQTREPSISREQLKVEGRTVFEVADGQVRFFHDSDENSTSIAIKTSKSTLHLSQLSNIEVQQFVHWMDSVHCIQIDQYPSKMDESADREEEFPDFEMENLAGWYRHLVQNKPVENIKFLSSIRDVLDGFQTLRFSSDEDGTRKLWADFSGPKENIVRYAISELSDGQRYLLALYMIVQFLIAKGDTVFIDEPDNFISLREIQPWLLAAEEAWAGNNGQLILISHHPELLNQWASECGLRFFREANGFVRTEKFKNDLEGNLLPAEVIARGWDNE